MGFGWELEIKIPKTACVLPEVLNGKGLMKGIKALFMEGFA